LYTYISAYQTGYQVYIPVKQQCLLHIQCVGDKVVAYEDHKGCDYVESAKPLPQPTALHH